MRKQLHSHRQRGASLIAAVFLITVLAAMGVVATRILVTSSTESVNEMLSAQALYAAESGIDFAAYQLVTVPAPGNLAAATKAAAQPVGATSSFTTAVVVLVATPTRTVYGITSTGTAGGTVRTLVAQFAP